MSRSVKLLSNSIARRAASWMASFLAVASVSLLGRSGAAAASPAVSLGGDTLKVGHSDLDLQVTYLQIGVNTSENQDWWPPLPE